VSNLIDIRRHPKFQGRLNPEDPNYERDQYLRYFDEGAIRPPRPIEDCDQLDDLDALMDLEEREEKPVATRTRQVQVGLSVCRDCSFKHDRRSWWRRFFLPDSAQATDLSCQAFARRLIRNPVTGREGYLPEGPQIPAYAQEEAFPRCILVNPIGTCAQFKPKITYR
jgi:hypothetical protein